MNCPVNYSTQKEKDVQHVLVGSSDPSLQSSKPSQRYDKGMHFWLLIQVNCDGRHPVGSAESKQLRNNLKQPIAYFHVLSRINEY